QRAALAPIREHAAVLDRLEELAEESALADAGNADDRQQLRRALLAHASQSIDDLGDLALAADERRALLRREADAEASSCRDDLPHWNRRLLALRLDRIVLAEVDRLPRRTVGRLADEDAVHRRCRLHARRRVDDVPGRHPFPGFRLRAEVDEHLA